MNETLINQEDIVVTGIGMVTPLGAGRETSWRGVLSGNSAVEKGGARAPLTADSQPRTVQLALTAAQEALTDAGLQPPSLGERWGCVVSASKPIISGTDFLQPDRVPQILAQTFGVQGPVMNLSAACATGVQSAMVGAEWLKEGRCDAVLCGAAESSLEPLYQAGFEQMGVLSKEGRVRPFDRGRDGFVIGEGAAVFVLERASGARDRGAPSYGFLRGWDFSCDAHHATRFNSNGAKIARGLARAMDRAGVAAAQVGYVNAHGTATPLNDRLEAQALTVIFSGTDVSVSSTKGATGHLLGATGAVELAFTLLALRDGRLPPTLHLQAPETKALDFVPGRAQAKHLAHAATVSFGFGGAIGALVAEAAHV